MKKAVSSLDNTILGFVAKKCFLLTIHIIIWSTAAMLKQIIKKIKEICGLQLWKNCRNNIL